MSEPGAEVPEVWRFDDHPGYRKSIESAGTVAAPLLGGFAFTLFALVVPTLNDHRDLTPSTKGSEVWTESAAFSGIPEVAAGFLLLAGLALVFSVQAAIELRYHNHRPSEIMEIYPEYFPVDGSGTPLASTQLAEWATDEWPAVKVGDQWYGRWPRRYLYEEWKRAGKSASRMRWLYHLGIISLLIGLTAFVWPPAHSATASRWILVGVGATGVLIEALWIAIPTIRSWRGSK